GTHGVVAVVTVQTGRHGVAVVVGGAIGGAQLAVVVAVAAGLAVELRQTVPVFVGHDGHVHHGGAGVGAGGGGIDKADGHLGHGASHGREIDFAHVEARDVLREHRVGRGITIGGLHAA